MNKRMFSYILGIALILFGSVFIMAPQGTFETIVLVAGIILITISSLGILRALISKNPTYAFTIGGSIIGITFGIVLIVGRTAAVNVIPVILGLWLIITGLTAIIYNSKIKGSSSLLFPICRLILGIIVFAFPIIPVTFAGIFLGIILILSGATTIMNTPREEVLYKVKVKNTKK